jgi:hypothetical protein
MHLKIRTLALIVSLVSLSFTGCTTMKDTNVRKNEKITLEVYPLGESTRKDWITDAGEKALKAVASYSLNYISKQYIGNYGAEAMYDDAVTISLNEDSVPRYINKTVVFKRYVGDELASQLIFDISEIGFEDGPANYFRIVPVSFTMIKAKAKMTRFLKRFVKADVVWADINIDIIFPDKSQKDGLSVYSHSFRIEDMQPGITKPLKNTSMAYDIPSYGPMAIKVKVTEENRLMSPLKKASESIK